MPFPALARPYSAILFDIDGTLADSISMIVAGLGDAIEHFSGQRPPDATLRTLIGRPLADQMQMLGMPPGDRAAIDDRIRFTMGRFDAHQSECALFDPAVQAWRLLVDGGMPTALVTSKNRDELNGFLDDFPALKRATTHVSSSDTDRPKPFADPAIEACRRLKVAPETALFIGDAVFDIQCAHAAGMPCLAVAYGASPADDLRDAGPEGLLARPEDLLNWVRQHLTTLCDASPTLI